MVRHYLMYLKDGRLEPTDDEEFRSDREDVIVVDGEVTILGEELVIRDFDGEVLVRTYKSSELLTLYDAVGC